MLGLPSTTEVSLRLPKEAFYRNLKLDSKTREQFVHGVESITVVNSIKPSTANIVDGKMIHEILVVAVQPRGKAVPEAIIRTISNANANGVVVVDLSSGTSGVVFGGRVYQAKQAELALRGRTLDDAWSSMLAQIIFGDDDSSNIEERIARKEKVAVLELEIARLEEKARKEKQFHKKNELIERARMLRSDYSKRYYDDEVVQ